MQTDNYRTELKSALENLNDVNGTIYSSCIHIAMQGELEEWNKSVPAGEVHHFDFELLQNSDDTNIQLLLKLMSHVSETYESLKNINNINLGEEQNDKGEKFKKIISDCLTFKEYSEIYTYLSNLFPSINDEEKNGKYRELETYIWDTVRNLGLEAEIIDYVGYDPSTCESEIECVQKLTQPEDVYAGMLHFLSRETKFRW